MNKKIMRLDTAIWTTMGVISVGLFFLSILPDVKIAAIVIMIILFFAILLVAKYLTADFLEESMRQKTRKRFLAITMNGKNTAFYIQTFPDIQGKKEEKIFFISYLPPINNRKEV